MALSGATLNPDMASKIRAGLAAQFGASVASLSPSQQGQIQSAWQKLADAIATSGDAIVQHIESDAVVTVTGVTVGGGTATGTIL